MPPDLHDWTFLPFWLTVPVAMAAIWVLVDSLLQGRPRVWPAAAVVLFFAEGLRSVRYIPIYGILIVPFVGWLVWHRALSRDHRLATAEVPLFGWRPRIVLPSLLAAVLVLAVTLGYKQNQFHQKPIAFGYPVASAAVLASRYPYARLFNTYGWGGYLIDRLYPTERVYIDGREDMYGDAFVRRYLTVEGVRPGWQAILNQAGITVALVPRTYVLFPAMAKDPGWKMVYEDANSGIFVPAR